MKFKKLFIFFIITIIFLTPTFSQAVEIVQDTISIEKARVIEVLEEEIRNVPGTNLDHSYQKIKVVIIKGENTGQEIVIENDYLNLEAKDKVYIRKTIRAQDGSVVYAVSEPDRIPMLLFLGILFIVLTIFLGGKQGVRGIVSLVGSLVLILFVFLPGLLKGFSPIWLSLGVSSLIIVVGSYITHGFSRTTTSAVVGMIISVAFTIFLAVYAVNGGHLSGYETDEAVYLTINTNGGINIVGLLLGGMIIGLLGVLYDAAIGQAIFVEELYRADKNMNKKKVFERSLRMGREHIGALVDTLAIAYVGASLPLLLYFFSVGDINILEIINREIFATEIVRILVGSIGLILAVPITTICSIYMLHGRLFSDTKNTPHGHHH